MSYVPPAIEKREPSALHHMQIEIPIPLSTDLRNDLTDHGVHLLAIVNDPDNNTVVMTMSDFKELLDVIGIDPAMRDRTLRLAFHEFRVTKIDHLTRQWRR